MRTSWHWGLGMGGILLAHTASAEQGDAAASVGAGAQSAAGPAVALEPAVAPVSAASVTPAPALSTWGEPPEQPSAAPRAAPPPERWYGWQILVSDAASLTFGLASSQGWPAAAGYLVAPPLIHVFHGQGTRALASAGMRIGLPLVGYAIAVEGGRSCSSGDFGPSFCEIGTLVLGFVVGISALGLDPAFAYEPVKVTERTRASVAPQILISDRQTRFGLVGSF